MARGDDPNSATCQFFVMHAAAPALDGKYSAFGTLLDGLDALDKIVAAPGTPLDPQNQTFRPREPQRIEHAVVLVAP
jgi:cyclophilin family peptidyl-prolyl cis-trans isomerase